MSQSFRQRLLNGEPLIGTMVTLNCSGVAELLAMTGFDWLFIDGEHGPFETRDLQEILQAVPKTTACLVRLPAIDEVPVKKALDLGAAGIIGPQVNSAEQARQLVQFCRYPPEGTRGIGLGRAHGYGTCFAEYLSTANREVVVVVQAEHRLAVENIESIVSVSGIDAVLVGPNDLAASYGKLGQFEDPEIVSAIQKIESACRAADIPMGIFGVSAESVLPFMRRGFRLIVVGVDALLLGSAAGKLLQQLR